MGHELGDRSSVVLEISKLPHAGNISMCEFFITFAVHLNKYVIKLIEVGVDMLNRRAYSGNSQVHLFVHFHVESRAQHNRYFE